MGILVLSRGSSLSARSKVFNLALELCHIPTKCVVAGVEHDHFLAVVGLFCGCSHHSVDLDFLAVCVCASGNYSSNLCHVSIHYDCGRCHGIDAVENLSGVNAQSIHPNLVLL